jgi:hypothetical protein
LNRVPIRPLAVFVLAAALTACGTATTGETVIGTEDPDVSNNHSHGAHDHSPDAACATDTESLEVNVRLADGVVDPAPDRVEVPLGTTVQIRVEVDSATEIHVHGYDVGADAEPSVPVCLEVQADTPGVFDVEAHPETLLLQLAVR